MVVFLNVGHGDATIVRLPDGTGLLVDGGGHHGDDGSTGRRVVLPALRALGITRLRAMVLTHPDADHLHGLLPVAAAMPPDELWWNGQVVASPTELALVATLLAAGTRLEVVGDRTPRRVLAGVAIDVLAPTGRGPEGTFDPARGPNDSSVVLLLQYGDVKVLLTGDAEAGAEQRMLSARRLRAPVTVVKVPHHGSPTSSTPAFVAALGAAHAVVSGDQAGRHRLPKPAILARWSAAGARIHRTDRHGAVTFTTDGRRLRVAHGVADQLLDSRDSTARTGTAP
jgi:competence protein ComEC